MTENFQEKKNTNKASRTILINDKEKTIDTETLVGLVSNVKTASNSLFLEFDTIDNSVLALEKLKEDGVRVKYAYYKLFLKISTDISNLSYDDIKEAIKANSEGNVLYFKLYKKNDKLIGSGDFSVDKLSDFNNLIKKDYELDINGTLIKYSVYRFRIKKLTPNGQISSNVE
jgi:hypothetical protein